MMVFDASARPLALEPPTGWQFVLERPGQRAVVTEVGAALRSWRAAGRERLETFPVGMAGDGRCGKVIAPSPDSGLVLWVNWRPVRRGADRVALEYVLHPQPGYPHTVGIQVEYALVATGLEVALRATNLGAEAAPFAAAFMPCVRAAGCEAVERRHDGGAAVRAGQVALWTDAGFAAVRAEPGPHGVTLIPATGGPLELAPGEALAGRWGLCLVGD